MKDYTKTIRIYNYTILFVGHKKASNNDTTLPHIVFEVFEVLEEFEVVWSGLNDVKWSMINFIKSSILI